MKWRQQIEDHYQQVWGIQGRPYPFAAGPIQELPSDFTVLTFRPHGSREMWTFATCGMSTQEDTRPLELHIFSQTESKELIELLVATAHFHRTGESLDLGHSVYFGKPWQNESLCDHGLISLPYLDGPALENLSISSSVVVKCYWLIPVTRTEVEYKKTYGLEALEQEFERQAFNYLDPHRRSVV